jgi:hypothetical protein
MIINRASIELLHVANWMLSSAQIVGTHNGNIVSYLHGQFHQQI